MSSEIGFRGKLRLSDANVDLSRSALLKVGTALKGDIFFRGFSTNMSGVSLILKIYEISSCMVKKIPNLAANNFFIQAEQSKEEEEEDMFELL